MKVYKDVVVCYDRFGMFSAPRAWYTFRHFGHQSAFVLDGGLPALKALLLEEKMQNAEQEDSEVARDEQDVVRNFMSEHNMLTVRAGGCAATNEKEYNHASEIQCKKKIQCNVNATVSSTLQLQHFFYYFRYKFFGLCIRSGQNKEALCYKYYNYVVLGR